MQAESILSHHSSVYSIVTEQILKQLESGVAPWHKPWSTQIPKNLVNGRGYRGINVFLLSSSGYGSPYWLTYKQATERGGHVRKGEPARGLSSGKSARGRPKTQTETLSSESLSCCVTTLCSTWSNARELPHQTLRAPSIRLRNASESSARCRIRQQWSKTDARGIGHLLTVWGCPPGMRSIQPRSITPRYSTS
jgi:hypothetical protein